MIKTYEDWENSLDQNYVNQLGPDAWDLTCGAFEAGQQSQQAKIDLLEKELTETQAFLNNQNHIKQAKIDELQARIDGAWNELDDRNSKEYIIEKLEKILKGNKDEN